MPQPRHSKPQLTVEIVHQRTRAATTSISSRLQTENLGPPNWGALTLFRLNLSWHRSGCCRVEAYSGCLHLLVKLQLNFNFDSCNLRFSSVSKLDPKC